MFPTLLVAAALLAPAADPPAKNPFVFADGDRVVLLGGTLIEREQKYGYWELALTLLNKHKKVTFRNLGWSGDTVWCESRGSFDGPKKGYENTVALLKELKPTVVVICYGQVESFDGEAGVKRFTEGLERLIDGVSVTKARVVLMTPTPFENTKPLTDAEGKNKNLRLYVSAMQGVAEKRKLEFAKTFENWLPFFMDSKRSVRLTENGVHLSAIGYEFTRHDAFDLSHSSVDITKAERQPKEDALREAIVAKNELFFHRWRPQNHTYLFGFRAHEQGQNAKEVKEQLDPLVEKAEAKIDDLRKKVK